MTQFAISIDCNLNDFLGEALQKQKALDTFQKVDGEPAEQTFLRSLQDGNTAAGSLEWVRLE